MYVCYLCTEMLRNIISIGPIDKYVDEAQRTRPLNVNVVNTSDPAPICKYLINDSGAVNICMLVPEGV